MHQNLNLRLNFTKMEALGNDFVIIDATTQPFILDKEHIKYLSDRKFGIGCDQVLIIEPTTNNQADFIYRIFNADGVEAENCGNGARCIIAYLYANNMSKSNSIRLQTQNRIIVGSKNGDLITVNVGNPLFNPDALPFIAEFNKKNEYCLNYNGKNIEFGIVSMGNPHVVIELHSINELQQREYWATLAQFIQTHSAFPQSVNVNFFVKTSSNEAHILTYERAVGFTLACGTGSTAVASYGISKRFFENKVQVLNTGGKLTITWDGINEAILTGPAKFVFEGMIWL